MTLTRPKFVVEDLVTYEMSSSECRTLESMGLIFYDETETSNEDERFLTPFIWHDLDLKGETAFLLFDAILGRKKKGDD